MFLYHGKKDPLLPLKSTEKTYEYLMNEIYSDEHMANLKFTAEAGLGHSLSQTELGKIKQWSETVFDFGGDGSMKDEL